eukprot:3938806-Rhodomonas_salina.1
MRYCVLVRRSEVQGYTGTNLLLRSTTAHGSTVSTSAISTRSYYERNQHAVVADRTASAISTRGSGLGRRVVPGGST